MRFIQQFRRRLPKNYEFNPFYFQKFCGQILYKDNMMEPGLKEKCINITFAIGLFCVYAMELYTLKDRFGEG